MLNITKLEFEKIIEQTLNSLPEKFQKKLNNVAIFAKEEPDEEQIKKTGLKKGDLLFGLFEGFAQAKKLNFGPVLPDKITIFRKAILSQCSDKNELKRKIISTVKHEIAHHFGCDEKGAEKAGKR